MNIKRIVRAAGRFLTSEDYRFIYLANAGRYDAMPDEEYLKRMFKAIMGTELNLENPRTFNEKIQWLKLYDRRPEYTTMVDKYAVKKYVADRIGEQYIIPTLGVWDDPDEIDFEQLSEQFVLKCTHNSGLGMCICRDKSKLNYDRVRAELRKGLAQDYYALYREWSYKDVKPRIIAEKYMKDSETAELRDYKFFCFNGKVEFLYLSEGLENHETARISYVTLDWKPAPFCRDDYKPFEVLPLKPENLDEMIRIAEQLSKGIPHVRVDLYDVNGKIFFGELTFYTGSGFTKLYPEEWNLKLGQMIQLPKKK